jgi:hypothetical protein
MINLGFLTEGKSAAILITPSSWGSQRAGHSPRIKAQLGKIAESQTLILARFAPEPNPVEELKMIRVEEDKDFAELDYSNALTPYYLVNDLVKIITIKNSTIEGGSEVVYQQFINQVAMKLREL